MRNAAGSASWGERYIVNPPLVALTGQLWRSLSAKPGMFLLNIATSPGRARSVDLTECTYNLHISRKIVVYYAEIKRDSVCAFACTTINATLACLHAPERYC